MDLSIKSDIGSQRLAVSGVINSSGAGQLLDAVVAACLQAPGETLVVDLTSVTHVTRAGVRGLVIAAKLAQYQNGALKIIGSRPSVDQALSRLGYNHLFKHKPETEERRAILMHKAS